MAYTPHTLEIVTCPEIMAGRECDATDGCPAAKAANDGYWCDEVRDSRDGDKHPLLRRGAYLPHSCDQWVIGGPDEIRALIADLQAALSVIA